MNRTLIPGLLFLLMIGLVARLTASTVPPVNYLIVTITLSFSIGNTYGVPDWACPGVETHKFWLETGIVLMGASVVFDCVVAAGPTILLLVIITVVSTILII
jgi:uncharacterized membrane protein YadS